MEISEEALGRRLTEIREGLGKSQSEFATDLRAANIRWSQGTLSKVETGQRPIRLSEAVKLAALLGVGLPDLVSVGNFEQDEIRAWLNAETRLDSLALGRYWMNQGRTASSMLGHLNRTGDSSSANYSMMAHAAEETMERAARRALFHFREAGVLNDSQDLTDLPRDVRDPTKANLRRMFSDGDKHADG